MSGFHPKDLIKEVRIREGIYNKNALKHPRREHKHQLWAEVAEKLTPAEEWDSYTEVEKEARMDKIQNKWKHLREHFYREIKLLEAGEAHKKRKYIYFDDMKFMRPYVGNKLMPKRQNKTSGSVDYSQEILGTDSDIDMDALLKSTENVEEDDVANNSSLKKERTPLKRVIKSSSKALKNKPLIKNFSVINKTESSSNPSFRIRDGDISFSLSLVPTLRKMGDSLKLRAKIEILKILYRCVNHIERRNRLSRHNLSPLNADMEEDMDDEDHYEEYDEPVTIKQELNDDPLNEGASGAGNTKTWWT